MTESIFAGSPIAKGFKTDKAKEESGVWRLHQESGILTRIRRDTLPEHRRAVRRHHKPFAHLTRLDPVDDLLVRQKAAAEVLVADWGVAELDDLGQAKKDEHGEFLRTPMVNGAGEEIRPTPENVLAAFKEMPDYYAWVAEEAGTFENYRVEAVQESAGNSSRSSGGSGNGERQAQARSSSAERPEEPESARSSEDPS